MEDIGTNYLDVNEDVGTYLPSNTSNIDKEPPIINIKQKTYVIKTNEKINLLEGVTASDLVDGDLTNSIKTNIKDLDFSKEGIKRVEYSVSDNAGNTAFELVYVTVKKDYRDIIRLGQIGILFIIFILLLFINKYLKSIKLEKRFSKYTINSSKNKSISLFDSLNVQYTDFVNKLSRSLSKSVFLKNKSKRYEKYVNSLNINSAIEVISKKIIVGFLFIIFAITVGLLQSRLSSVFEMLISFIIGFYTLDIIYFYRYSKYKKKIQNDLLDAISIMNNAFKAGMSITQAIDLVSREVNGPISKEFEKISTDIRMGLDIEIAFRRFSKRIKSEEAMYLASSLSVLNRTGGNIIKVFNSIEKNMFNRRKLNNELKSLTASSKLIMYALMVIPPLFIIFISIISKDYFEPLFTNPIGIILILIMSIIYITYIIVVMKVLKVRGIK
jgi:tight adherence protein B